MTAFPTTKECEAALAEQFSRLKSEGWNPSYPQVRTVMAFKGKGEIMVATHYRCLPDTVDPRGPKGK